MTPLGSEQDASEAMTRLGERYVRNVRAEVALRSERQLEPPRVAGADEVWAREQRTTGRAGEGASLMLGVRVGAVVGVVALSGRTATWPAVTAAGEQLVTRIRSRDRG
ncbi:MAG: hypothetical protein ACXV2J_14255 [Actinomycetes bacterium]